MTMWRTLLVGIVGLLASCMFSPAQAQPLRTPDARFAGLPGYAFAPHYVDVPWGDGRVRMHYVDEGPRRADPILLLHGQPSWSYMFRAVIAGLVARGHRVIAPDLIGYGRSDKPREMADYSYDRHLRALRALIEGLNLRRATLAVHDWGGLLGLPTLAAMPDRFARVALFNTSLNDGSDPETPQFRAGFDRWIALLRTAPLVEVDRVIAAQSAATIPSETLRAYMAPFPDGSYQSGVRQMSALIPRTPDYPRARENGEVRRWLGTWRRPVLIAFSEDSERLHPGQFALFNRLFPATSIWASLRLPGTRHFLFEDRPDLIVTYLDAFASGQRPPVVSAAPDTTLRPPPGADDALTGARLQADVARYAGCGDQRTGTAAAASTLRWLEERLRAAGYRTSRVPLPVRRYDIDRAEATVGASRIDDGIPLWPVVWTGDTGIAGRLRLLDQADATGDIVLARLPFSPGASLYDPRYREIVGALRRTRLTAAILVTEHPSGEAVALNVRDDAEAALGFPVLVVGQRHLATLNEAMRAGTVVRLRIDGRTVDAADFNLIAERGPAEAPALVVSTPRNGWFRSGGERGPGIALALALANHIARTQPNRPVRFLFTSHHELGGAGIRQALSDPRFSADRVRAWVHLGANIATSEARFEGGRLERLAGPNARRGAAASGPLLELARRQFAAVPSLPVEDLAAGNAVGEIRLIARDRTHPMMALVGYQLLHHTRLDTEASTNHAVLEPVARALAAIVAELE